MKPARVNVYPTIARLARLDTMLAGDGVVVRTAAKRLRVSLKTIRRDLDFLHTISPLVFANENVFGVRRWYYAHRRRQVFSPWVSARKSR